MPDPIIMEPTDIVVRIDCSTICDTDLHILTGDVPEELSDEQVLFLADILPTAYEVGVLTARSRRATPWRSSAPARPAWRQSSPRSSTRRGASSRSTSTTAVPRPLCASAPTRPSTTAARTLWIRDVTITTGLIASGRLDPTIFATHRYPLGDTMAAYDPFSDAARTGALKVVLEGRSSLGTNGRGVVSCAGAA